MNEARGKLLWLLLFLVLGALVLLLVPGCTARDPTAPAAFAGTVAADGSADFTLHGVRFTATPDARIRMEMSIETDREPDTLLFCRDRLLQIRSKELTIAGRSYGLVRPGQSVHLDASGVHVDGDPRGSLPE